MHLPYPPLTVQLQVHFLFSTSLTHVSLFQLQVHCPLSTSPTRVSPFHRHLSCYRCVARSLLLRCALLLSTTWLQVRCLLSTTGAHLPFPPLSVEQQVPCTLSTSHTHISPFHCWLFNNRLSASFQSTTPFLTAGYPVRGSFSPLHLMFISLLTPFPKRVRLKHVPLQRLYK